MSQLITLIFIGLAGVWLGNFLARRKRARYIGSLEQANQVGRAELKLSSIA